MRATTLAVTIALALLLAAPLASAHKTAYSPDGKVKIVWGFLHEPAVTMTKNGLDLRIQDNATGYAIPDLQSVLHVELRYGDEEMEFHDFAGQFGKPGYYTGTVTPTRAGIYTLHVSGTVNGTELDMDVQGAHAVEAIEDTYFPAYEPSTGGNDAALQARVQALEAKVAALEADAKTQSSTPTPLASQPTGGSPAKPTPGPALALLALAAVGAALALRRRS